MLTYANAIFCGRQENPRLPLHFPTLLANPRMGSAKPPTHLSAHLNHPALARCCCLESAVTYLCCNDRFGVVSTCAPLLRVSPGLASTPIAQLMASSGIIYTADPSKAFGRAGSATATASTSTSTSFCSAGDGNDDDDVAPAAVGSACTEESCDAGASSTGCATYTLPPNVGNTTLQTVEGGGGADSQKGATTEAVAEAMVDTNEPCDPAEAHQHSLVLSGRRVWVVSPVVGWASVWAETGQKILRPAAEIEEEERAAKEKGGMGIGGLPGPAGPSEVEMGMGKGKPGKGLSDIMLALGISGKAGGSVKAGGAGGEQAWEGEEDWGGGLKAGGGIQAGLGKVRSGAEETSEVVGGFCCMGLGVVTFVDIGMARSSGHPFVPDLIYFC